MRTNNAHYNRRNFVTATGTGFLACFAGCLGNEDEVENGDGLDEGEGTADPIEITINDQQTDEDTAANASVVAWYERVEERYDGVHFERFPGEQLGGAAENLELMQGGTIDMGSSVALYFSDQLGLSTIDSLPGLDANTLELTMAYRDLVEDLLYELEWEQNGIRPMIGVTTPPISLFTTFPVDEPSDLEGKNIFSPGGLISNALEAYGATAVEMTGQESFTALERGTIDGATNAFFAAHIYGYEEEITHAVSNLSFGDIALNYPMRLETYNSLPDELQTVMHDTADEIYPQAGQAMYESNQDEIDWFEEQGVEIVEVDVDTWAEPFESIHQGWIDQHGEQGQQVYDAYMEKINEYQGFEI